MLLRQRHLDQVFDIVGGLGQVFDQQGIGLGLSDALAVGETLAALDQVRFYILNQLNKGPKL